MVTLKKVRNVVSQLQTKINQLKEKYAKVLLKIVCEIKIASE